MTRKTLVAAALLALAAVAAAPAPAHAQLGGALKRAAKKKIEDKVGGGDAPAQPAAGAPGAAGSSAGPVAIQRGSAVPTFDGNTLEMTPEVVDRFLKAAVAEAPAKAAMAKDRANEGKYRATIDKYERCNQKEQEKLQEEMAAKANDPKMVQWQLEYYHAIMSGDTARVRAWTDSLITLGMRPSTVCGARPTDAYQGVNRIENADREVEGTAADAGDFSVQQYSIMKERVIPWLEAKKRGTAMRGGFSKTEQDALEAKSDALMAALKDDLGK